MDGIDAGEPIYFLYVGGAHVATLFDPQYEDMFWCSYRVETTSSHGDLIVHDDKMWENVNFVVKDQQGNLPNPSTFSGGYSDFCARKTNRLSFRSLWPPQQKSSSVLTRLRSKLRSIWGALDARLHQRANSVAE